MEQWPLNRHVQHNAMYHFMFTTWVQIQLRAVETLSKCWAKVKSTHKLWHVYYV